MRAIEGGADGGDASILPTRRNGLPEMPSSQLNARTGLRVLMELADGMAVCEFNCECLWEPGTVLAG